MSKIGLLTGTFDPIHLGHIEMARVAMRTCNLDAVWIMVNSRQQSAPSEHKAHVVAFKHRLAMAEQATAETSGIIVYRGPLVTEPHTMQTFMHLMQQNPDDKFVFIVGMDTIARLDGWSDIESVVRNASFVVAHRATSSVEAIGSLRQRLGALGGHLAVEQFSFDEHGNASSMEIRTQLKAGHVPRGLDSAVSQYIAKHGLYADA